jgi:Skp family chaperone for outer membrane proteins
LNQGNIVFSKDRLWMSGAAAGALAVALIGGYLWGRHGVNSAYADVSTTPQSIASADGAPLVPGLCVLSQSAVYANAKIGQAATTRYRELTARLREQLLPAQQAIQDDAKKLEAAKAGMPVAEYQKKSEELAARLRGLQSSSGQDTRDLEATRQKALRQIAAYANPVIADAYKDHHCGALFSRDTMLVGNPGMDLTPVVVAGLDTKVTTITFDLEKAPTSAPGQAAR